jgi:hypothetical protein
MSRAQRILLFVAGAAAALTGAPLAWWRIRSSAEELSGGFGGPLEPLALDLHILLVPLLLFAVGWIFGDHVLPRLAARKRLASGVAMLGLFAALAVSGYALQVAVSEGTRFLLAWTHGGAGLLWTIVFLFHAFGRAHPGSEVHARRD